MPEQENIAVLIGNLPPQVTEDDLQDALEGLGYDLDIKLRREGSAEKVTAIVRFDGMTRAIAEKLKRG
jgi:RNA recognition motif-containing protein